MCVLLSELKIFQKNGGAEAAKQKKKPQWERENSLYKLHVKVYKSWSAGGGLGAHPGLLIRLQVKIITQFMNTEGPVLPPLWDQFQRFMHQSVLSIKVIIN